MKLTEVSVSDKLEGFRAKQKVCLYLFLCRISYSQILICVLYDMYRRKPIKLSDPSDELYLVIHDNGSPTEALFEYSGKNSGE